MNRHQQWLYHVTSKKNAKSILKNGLIPSGAYVSLSTDPYSWWKKGLVILEVDIEDLPVKMNTFLPELDEIIVWGKIMPERIRLFKDSRKS